jgi:hypothetical protein
MLHGRVQIGYSLRLHSLGSIHEKEHTFAGSQCAGYFVREIHVTRGIDQIQFEYLTGSARVGQGHGLALDGNASFPFDLHVIEDLIAKLPVADQAGVLNHSIGQGGFSMIDVSNDTEVSNLPHGQFLFSLQRNVPREPKIQTRGYPTPEL